MRTVILRLTILGPVTFLDLGEFFLSGISRGDREGSVLRPVWFVGDRVTLFLDLWASGGLSLQP